MSRIPFHRPARMTPPLVPEEKLNLAAAPQLPSQNGASGFLMILLPLLTSVSMAAYLIASGRMWMIVLGVVFIVSSTGFTIGIRMQMRGKARRTREHQRKRYLEYLAGIRRQVRQLVELQRLAAAWTYPSPQRLWAIVHRRRRVWERRPDDPDFLRVRIGAGDGPLASRIVSAKRNDPSIEYDLPSVRAAEELVQVHGTVERQPAWIDIGQAGVVSILGSREEIRSAGTVLLCQLAVLHAPDDVQVVVVTGGDPEWEWAKWLPHTHEPDGDESDAEVVPLVAESLDGLTDYLEAELGRAATARAERGVRVVATPAHEAAPRRRLVVVLNGYDPQETWTRSALVLRLLSEAGPQLGITVICPVTDESHEPGRVDVRVRVDARGRVSLEGRRPALHSTVADATVDLITPVLRDEIARGLAPLTLSGESDQLLLEGVSLPGMLGLPDIATLDPRAAWRAPDDEEMLRVPVGVDGEGEALVLDLKESAQGGIGPHGLIVGATGSGKSELLRTLVTGLAMTHSPEHLGFVLIDFKGGATFAGLTGLPHVAGLITNLADELSLVERVRVALRGEQQRRQRLLRQAGNVDSIHQYQLNQAAGRTDVDGMPLVPMPYLMIVVDEFGELLSQQADFIDLFVQIGRVGRSLGMHLLLATQRLEEGRLRGLESHLSYRICLRTFSAAESRAVIGTPDAYMLPAIPGSAYLKVDESVYERFRVAHVSRLYQDPSQERPAAVPLAPIPFTLRSPTVPVEPVQSTGRERVAVGDATELQVLVERLAMSAEPTHQVWLPPLPTGFSLDLLLGSPERHQRRGLQASAWQPGELKFPVAVVDLPARQEQRPLVIDLAGVHGHLALVGAPQSGKSLFLRTVMVSGMLTHTPDELQFYCVDHGGGALHGLAEAPHVAGVAGRRDRERIRQVLTEVSNLVTTRERMFQDLGIQSAAEFRRLRDSGGLPPGVRGADVVLVVDNWAALHAEMDDATAIAGDIAARGLGVGVHLLLAANRWAEIRPGLRDNIGGRLELRLNDPAESEVNRQEARRLGRVPAGRGLMPPGLPYHVALPRLDGRDDTEGLTEAQQRIVAATAEAWMGTPAPSLRILPKRITVAELQTIAVTRSAAPNRWENAGPGLAETDVPIGLREGDLWPVGLDLAQGRPHFLAFGDSGAGKTSFLRTWMRGMARLHSPWDVRLILIDYRRSLLDVLPGPYIGAQAGDPDRAAIFVKQMVEKLRERMPPADVTAQGLRERAWWSGPELYLVIDDYDLVSSGPDRGPLAPLADFVTQSEELGFHIMLARRVGGAARALMSDPLLGRLREFGADGLILSGDPREGSLVGEQRAAQREPGRGVLVRRRQNAEVIQVAVDDGSEPLDPVAPVHTGSTRNGVSTAQTRKAER